MTHFCLLVVEGADVVGATGVFVVMVVVLALLTLLVYCLFAAFGGGLPKGVCLPEVPKLLEIIQVSIGFSN